MERTPSHGSAGRVLLSIALFALSAVGCGSVGRNSATTQPATTMDPQSARDYYWLDKPAVAQAQGPDFDRLWNACRDAIQDDGFTIDRTDYRDGLLTSLPLPSKQFYELWRNDVVDARDLIQSSLGTVRRTVRFQIRRLNDGSYKAVPKVVVERYVMLEKRITSVSEYQYAFSLTTVDIHRTSEEQGGDIPVVYWYAIGRDYALERHLADQVQRDLNRVR